MPAGITLLVLLFSFAAAAFGQAADTVPRFEAADVRAGTNGFFEGAVRARVEGERYVVRSATMVDLVAAAYGVKDSDVVDGPAWLEMDRFDVDAKLPPNTPQETVQKMLQSLLAERFNLVVHKDTRAQLEFVLTAGSGQPKLKAAAGTGDSGCRQQQQVSSDPGDIPEMDYSCRNITMADFAGSLQGLAPGYITQPVVDQTALKGPWDFDLHWTPIGGLKMAGPDGLTMFNAIDKELGLKLEQKTSSTPVLAVDSVNQKPGPNPPGTEKMLPPPPPLAFEVAVIKPSGPGEKDGGIRFSGDGLTIQNLPMKSLLSFAWALERDEDVAIAGIPKSLEGKSFDIDAKVDPAALAGSQVNMEAIQPMLRTLLISRFQIASHTEDRPAETYALVAAGPKLKKADPSSRTHCVAGPRPGEPSPRLTNRTLKRVFHCQNVTMAEFAAMLPDLGGAYLDDPIRDATGLAGRWDFTLAYSPQGQLNKGAVGSDPAQGGAAQVSDPNGAITLFEAVERELGLKLEKEKRPLPVLVIDHMLDAPVEN
jgi:uncharacterized protein (TIGR03435 family)